MELYVRRFGDLWRLTVSRRCILPGIKMFKKGQRYILEIVWDKEIDFQKKHEV